MNILKVTVATSLLILAAGCGDSATGPTEPNYVASMTVGNYYVFAVSGYTIDTGDTTTVAGTLTRTIASEVTHTGGFQLYRIDDVLNMTEPDTSSTTVSIYVRNESDEFRLYYDTTSTVYSVPFKYNAVVGDTWVPGINPTEQIEVTSLSAQVVAPAGTYNNCACTKETDSSEPGKTYIQYWGSNGEGVISKVEQIPGEYYLEDELTSIYLQ
ncbi:MAG: hypothetical protein K8S15_06465 [Candidatus Aegiribacteria sp.]|nr:hypothetical protein [Candidatus Aegiribacteria sp.]